MTTKTLLRFDSKSLLKVLAGVLISPFASVQAETYAPAVMGGYTSPVPINVVLLILVIASLLIGFVIFKIRN